MIPQTKCAQFCQNKTVTSNGLTSTDFESTNGSSLVYLFFFCPFYYISHTVTLFPASLRVVVVVVVACLFFRLSTCESFDFFFHSVIHLVGGVLLYIIWHGIILWIFGVSFRCYTVVNDDACCSPHTYAHAGIAHRSMVIRMALNGPTPIIVFCCIEGVRSSSAGMLTCTLSTTI